MQAWWAEDNSLKKTYWSKTFEWKCIKMHKILQVRSALYARLQEQGSLGTALKVMSEIFMSNAHRSVLCVVEFIVRASELPVEGEWRDAGSYQETDECDL